MAEPEEGGGKGGREDEGVRGVTTGGRSVPLGFYGVLTAGPPPSPHSHPPSLYTSLKSII